MTKKLYLVKLCGMQASVSGPAYGFAYVVATDAAEAYRKVRERLDSKDLGFAKDREMQTVTLLAEATDYPDCSVILYA